MMKKLLSITLGSKEEGYAIRQVDDLIMLIIRLRTRGRTATRVWAEKKEEIIIWAGIGGAEVVLSVRGEQKGNSVEHG